MKFNYSQQPGLKLKKELNLYNSQNALVTVITPYYNAGKYFEQTFNSVMNQTFPWFEWIIINDGSTNADGISILNSLTGKDGRIRVINQENKGVSYARNIGFENACTDIVIPLDADALISPQYIEYIYFAMLYNPGAARRYVCSAGLKADDTAAAIEYPLKKTENLYHKPDLFTLGEQYKVEKKHGKIRLLMIIPWMVMGGADKFNLQFAEGLNKNIYEISIITTVPSENDWRQKFELLTEEIFDLPDFLDSAYFADFVGYYIASRMIDVLLVSNSQAGYYMMPWIKSQFPHLLIIDYVHTVENYWKAGGHARTSAAFGEIVYKTYVCNNATRTVMIKQLGRSADSVQTVHVGVDHREFCRTNVEKGHLYQLLKVDEKRPLILFPCRINPLKRPFLMLEIADRVRRVREDILFVVIGDGEQLEELKSAIQTKGLENNVACIGRCDDMKLCYRDAFLTLVCSLKEGLALTAYESCSMGIPVISSDVGGQGDLIDDTVGALVPLRQNEAEGYDCREFDEEEIEDYVLTIQNFLNNPSRYKNCSIKCREKIENGFSIDNMVTVMEQEISEGLKKIHINSEIYGDVGTAGELYILFNLSEELQSGKAWLEKHCEEQEKSIAEIQKGKNWLEEQVKYKDIRIKELEDWIKELEKGKTWLEEQLRYKTE